MEVFLGISATDGVGIGTAFVIPDPVKRAIPQHRIKIDQLNKGWTRFENAIQAVTLDIALLNVQKILQMFSDAFWMKCWIFILLILLLSRTVL